MTEHAIVILLLVAVMTLLSLLVSAGAGYLARREHATYAQALGRAATAFAGSLTLTSALAVAWHTLTR